MVALIKLSKEDLLYVYTYSYSTKVVEPGKYFPGQVSVKSAFELALRTVLEGYNLYVSGPEGIGRTIYTLTTLKGASKNIREVLPV